MRLRRSLAALAAVMLLALSVPTASAGVYQSQTSCNLTTGPWRVCMYENTGLSGDVLTLTPYSTLSTMPNHTLSGYCAGSPWDLSDTWNDCISSVYVNLSAGYRACFYHDTLHRNLDFYIDSGGGGAYSLNAGSGGFTNDSISSVMVVYAPHAGC